MPYANKRQAQAVLIAEKKRGRGESHAAKAAKTQLRGKAAPEDEDEEMIAIAEYLRRYRKQPAAWIAVIVLVLVVASVGSTG